MGWLMETRGVLSYSNRAVPAPFHDDALAPHGRRPRDGFFAYHSSAPAPQERYHPARSRDRPLPPPGYGTECARRWGDAVVHRPGEVPAVVRREGGTDDCQGAAEEPVVDPEPVHVGAGERSELDELHGECR